MHLSDRNKDSPASLNIQYTLCIAVLICVYVLLYMVTYVCLHVSLQVFYNCSCVGVAGNFTANTGQCLHKDDCDRMFPYFLALSVITSFIISLGGTPGYMFLIRSDLNLKNIMKNDFEVTTLCIWCYDSSKILSLNILNHFTFDILMHLKFGCRL